jgi:hypothetical protein
MPATTAEKNLLKEIPNSPLNEEKILRVVSSNLLDKQSISFIKNFTKFNDQDISDLLKISIRTLRNYTVVGALLKTKLAKEHWIKILSLYKHGEEVFGDKDLFIEWLNESNYYFDNKPPIHFIDTAAGIKFIDNQLTGMQYGDNA